MKLHFYKTSDWASYAHAKGAGATRTLYFEDTEQTIIRAGGPARDLFDAVMAGIELMDATEQLCFVLTDDMGTLLDIFITE